MHLAVHVFRRPAGSRDTDFVVTVRARLTTSLLVLVLLGTDAVAAICTLECGSASTRSEGSSSRDAAHCESAAVDNEAPALAAVAGTKRSYRVRADALGRWAFHCHLLYHMESGMFREVRVEE
jgi:FtsP/CotA-like multicopper oxidase with cupredoxin domain